MNASLIIIGQLCRRSPVIGQIAFWFGHSSSKLELRVLYQKYALSKDLSFNVYKILFFKVEDAKVTTTSSKTKSSSSNSKNKTELQLQAKAKSAHCDTNQENELDDEKMLSLARELDWKLVYSGQERMVDVKDMTPATQYQFKVRWFSLDKDIQDEVKYPSVYPSDSKHTIELNM